MIAQLIDGEFDTADVFFIIAIVLFVLYAFMGFADSVKPQIHNVLLGLGLACLSIGLLVL